MTMTIEILPEFSNWRTNDSYDLVTCLGSDSCTVQFLEFEGIPVLKPGEDTRIRRAQIKLFCDWIIETKEKIESEQLRYILTTLELRQSTIAKALAVTEGSVSQFLSGDSKWKDSTHRQLVLLFLGELRQPGSIKSLAENKPPIDAILDRIPVGKLIKQGWMQASHLSDVTSNLMGFFRGDPTNLDSTVNVRFRTSYTQKTSEILIGCWIQHLKNLASDRNIPAFDRDRLAGKIPELLSMAEKEESIPQISLLLNECGVNFFVVKALKGSKFDGAAFLNGKNPIIGLTMRYERIDWFWFTLLHEVAHVLLHDISEGRVDSNPLKSELADEIEANRWAAETLVPEAAVIEFKQLKSLGHDDAIRSLAIKYKRHPGIIAGRLQHERKIRWDSKICASFKVNVLKYFQ